MPKAILEAIDDKWRVVIIDDDLEAIYTDPLTHSKALEIANDYNRKEFRDAPRKRCVTRKDFVA
jgi:hypothetical protein